MSLWKQADAGPRVSDFDFALPPELIAQTPPEQRGESRMLVMDRASGALEDSQFGTIVRRLSAGDVLVVNDSRVIPARLYARRTTSRGWQKSTGAIEVLLTQPVGSGRWNALVRPGRKVRVGDQLEFDDAEGNVVLEAEVVAGGEFGERTLRFLPDKWKGKSFFQVLDQIGHIPLPPYIERNDESVDRERYQTVYARERGSVAAPTAGLHFTPEVLAQIAARGVEIATVTLHVGLGTFAPLRVERVDQIELHTERYTLPDETAELLNQARAEARRIVAVGTTVVRTLEHCARVSGEAPLHGHSGETRIFISPGHEFQLVRGLVTNFHLPQSSLLMLVSAFAGREHVLAAYDHAVQKRYRFFSYGDCMLLL